MNDSWDKYAEVWDNNADVILYSKNAYDTLCKVINLEGKVILDFGCGTGLLTERMAPQASRILALDSSERMISVLNKKQLSNVDTLAAILSKETIESNLSLHTKFDLIVASSVCAFIEDYESTLSLLKTLLKPDGTFVQWDWLRTDDESDFGLTEEKIISAFLNVGMKVLSIKNAFALVGNKGLMKVIMGVAKLS